MKIPRLMMLTAMLLTVFLSSQVVARQEQPMPIDRSQAAEKAQQHVKGRVLRVDQTRSAYRVKVLKKNGRVISVDVDKTTGRVKPVKDKD